VLWGTSWTDHVTGENVFPTLRISTCCFLSSPLIRNDCRHLLCYFLLCSQVRQWSRSEQTSVCRQPPDCDVLFLSSLLKDFSESVSTCQDFQVTESWGQVRMTLRRLQLCGSDVDVCLTSRNHSAATTSVNVRSVWGLTFLALLMCFLSDEKWLLHIHSL